MQSNKGKFYEEEDNIFTELITDNKVPVGTVVLQVKSNGEKITSKVTANGKHDSDGDYFTTEQQEYCLQDGKGKFYRKSEKVIRPNVSITEKFYSSELKRDYYGALKALARVIPKTYNHLGCRSFISELLLVS